MYKGLVFDINEFAVHDGPGIRTSVFFKGCPLRCRWCHNPEGLSFEQEILRGTNGCIHCGACEAVCKHKNHCVVCGACINACPKNLRRYAAQEFTSVALAARLLKNRDLLLKKGGVTFSGGEPLAQADFLFDTITRIKPVHVAIETSGYASPEVFNKMLDLVDLVLIDIKHTDKAVFKEYTGVSNKDILVNFQILKNREVPFEIRIPVIPMVNDTIINMRNIAVLAQGAEKLVRVELLRYHKTAGAKYELLGKVYSMPPSEDAQNIEPLAEVFREKGIPVFIP
jgi:pyruvate formate lyase activating enzyme